MVPKSPLEDAVLAIYERELQSEGMGMDSNLFENSKDSLKTVHIVASLCRLHKEHPELQTGKCFLTSSVMDILRHHPPGALLQSYIDSSLGIKEGLWWPHKLWKMCLKLCQRLYWNPVAQSQNSLRGVPTSK